MDDNIFSARKERELQILRQRQASNIVRVDPTLSTITQRFNPDVSRASLLKAQRARAEKLTKAELEKLTGVKTAKKLKKRRGKNLRGEVARNLREQRRFEKGERRDKPEQEPRIVGDPIPPAPGAPAAPAADPNAQLRLAIEGRRIAAQDAQQRRLVDALMARDDAERGERQAILDRELRARMEIIGRSEVERQALLDRQAAITREERAEAAEERGRIVGGAELERDALRLERVAVGERAQEERAGLLEEERRERERVLQRAQAERRDLRGAFREILEGEARVNRQERQDLLDQAEAQREVIRREGREERSEILERQAARIERLGDEERRERIQREDQQAAGQVAERQRQREERQQVAVQAAEEREGILRLVLDADRDPVPEPGNTQADRDFLQRQFQAGLETIDRRIGESEARTAEQIRQHAERVSAVERQPPIVINQPPINIETPAQQAGPSAAEIASGVRDALQGLELQPSPRRRVNIEEDTTDTESETFSPRRSGRGGVSPDVEDRELIPREEQEQEEGGFSPVQSPRQRRQPRTPLSTGQGLGDLFPEGFPGGGEGRGEPEPEAVVAEPAQVPSQRIPELEGGGGALRAIPTSDPQQIPRGFAELEGSGVVVDASNLPQEGGQELYQSGQFAGDLEAAAQNAIGFVGDVAGRAAGGISNLVNPPPQVGEQTGGGLVDAEGNPIFGLGQEIEFPPRPTIQPLQSAEPARRPQQQGFSVGDTRTQLQKDRDELRLARSQETSIKSSQRAARSGGSRRGGRSSFTAKGELKRVQDKIRDLERRIETGEISERARERARERPQAQAGAGLVEEEEEGQAEARVAPSARQTNSQLYDAIRPEIDAYYTRGRAQGGARGSLPYQITNTTDRDFKGLAPGQTAIVEQVERDGKLGYYPRGRVGGGVGRPSRSSKEGIVRISESELRKQVQAGKLKLDRTR